MDNRPIAFEDVLQQRGNGGAACDAGSRIPTSRYPLFSTTLTQQITVGLFENANALELLAERDLLLSDMSVEILDTAAGTPVQGRVSIEYCNTDYVDEVDTSEWAYCCDRKPFFLVGVRENKRMRVRVVSDSAAPAGGLTVNVTFSGMQGNGCCA